MSSNTAPGDHKDNVLLLIEIISQQMLLLCMYMDGIKFQIVGEVWHTFFFFKIQSEVYIPILCDENRFKISLNS